VALKILLADDSMTAQNMGKKILTDAGFDVVAVSNGAAAMKKVAADKPDIIILDVYMPGYTGLEVCERIKNSLETSSTPVLLTVGKMEPFRPEEANRVRADGVMIKPFEATDLTAAVRTILEKVHGGALPAALSAPVAPPPKTNGNGQKLSLPAVLRDYEDTIRLTPEEIKEIEIQDAHYEEWKSSAAAEAAEYSPAEPSVAGTGPSSSSSQVSQPLMSAETASSAAVVDPATPLHQDELSGPPAAPPTEDYGFAVGANPLPAANAAPAAPLEIPLTEIPAFGVDFAEANTANAAPPASGQTAEPLTALPEPEKQEYELESSQAASPEAVGLPPLPELEFTAAPVETGEIQAATAPELDLTGSPALGEVTVATDPALVTNTDEDVAQFAVKVGQELPDDISTEAAAEWPSAETTEPSPAAEAWSEPLIDTAATDVPPACLPELSGLQMPPEPASTSFGESMPEAPSSASMSFGSVAFGDVLQPQADREEETQNCEPVVDTPLADVAGPAAAEAAEPEPALPEPIVTDTEAADSASTSAAGMMWEVSGSPAISFEQAAEKLEVADPAETFAETNDTGEITAEPAGADARIHELIEVNESAAISTSEMNLPPASEWFTPARPNTQTESSDLEPLQEEAPEVAPAKTYLAAELQEAAPEISAAKTPVPEEPAAEAIVEASPAFAPLAEATAAAAARMDQPPGDDQIERAVTRALERLKSHLISEISRELGSK